MASLKELTLDQQQTICQSAIPEVVAALSRTFDLELTATASPGKQLKISELPEELSGPGLAVVLTIGDMGMLVLLAEATNLVPSWCAAPDATGESKLKTLAQELGMLLLPDSLIADDFVAGRVRQMVGALGRAGVSDETWHAGLELSASDGRRGTAWIVWPVAHPGAVIGAGAARPKPKPAPPAKKPAPKPAGPSGLKPPQAPQPPLAAPSTSSPPPRRTVTSLRDLPDYTRSLLRIRVPVVVTLANNRQPLGRIVELGPGSIIHFEKSCEEMLDLEVGGRSVARGEAVKVGDKFGLRVTSITLPEERFKPVPPKRR